MHYVEHANCRKQAFKTDFANGATLVDVAQQLTLVEAGHEFGHSSNPMSKPPTTPEHPHDDGCSCCGMATSE